MGIACADGMKARPVLAMNAVAMSFFIMACSPGFEMRGMELTPADHHMRMLPNISWLNHSECIHRHEFWSMII
jgi:hypothetical protein